MIIIPGPASINLGERIAKELNMEAAELDHRVFPDGESYIRFKVNLDGESVVLIQTTALHPDKRLLQFFLMASTARDLGADHIICVIPYLAYARQDKRFLGGEALSLEIILQLFESSGVDDLIIIDVHNKEAIRRIQENLEIKVHNLSAIPLLAGYLKERDFEGAYSLSPDRGAIGLARSAANILGGESGYFEKTRDRTTGEIEMRVRDLNVMGKNAVVFDDIVSSGGTMARAVEGLKFQGANRVVAACSHALFIEGAEERIRAAGADLILASDTVETDYSQVTVAGMLADYLQTLD
jgi:ribose-phosphate pyrophosphokinase